MTTPPLKLILGNEFTKLVLTLMILGEGKSGQSKTGRRNRKLIGWWASVEQLGTASSGGYRHLWGRARVRGVTKESSLQLDWHFGLALRYWLISQELCRDTSHPLIRVKVSGTIKNTIDIIPTPALGFMCCSLHSPPCILVVFDLTRGKSLWQWL